MARSQYWIEWSGALPRLAAVLWFDVDNIIIIHIMSLNATSLLQGPTEVDLFAAAGEILTPQNFL